MSNIIFKINLFRMPELAFKEHQIIDPFVETGDVVITHGDKDRDRFSKQVPKMTRLYLSS